MFIEGELGNNEDVNIYNLVWVTNFEIIFLIFFYREEGRKFYILVNLVIYFKIYFF